MWKVLVSSSSSYLLGNLLQLFYGTRADPIHILNIPSSLSSFSRILGALGSAAT